MATNDAQLEGSPGDIASPESQNASSRASGVEGSTTSTQSDEIPFPELVPKIERLCLSIWSNLIQQPEPLLSSDANIAKTFAQRLLGRPAQILPMRLRSRSTISYATNPSRKVEIGRMTNGTFNRVVAITIPKPARGQSEMVLRIPRENWRTQNLERDVSILRFVNEHTSLPVANVIAFDFSDDNPLKSAYMVQSRIPGIDLLHHGDLTLTQACDVAKQLGHLMLAMQDTTQPWSGRVVKISEPGNGSKFGIRPLEIENRLTRSLPDHYKDCGDSWTDSRLQSFYSSHFNFLASQFGRWRAQELHDAPYMIQRSENIYKALVDLANEMDESQSLGRKYRDTTNSLCHLDLRSRNIMVQVQADGRIQITGILDWDSAVFAPFWVGCVPPHWLWADEDDETFDENDETQADRLPTTEHGRQVKKAWEDAVGEDFCGFSYEAEYRIARKLFFFAAHGIHSSWETREAQALIEDWRPIRAEYLKFMAEEKSELADEEMEKEEGQDRKELERGPPIDEANEILP